jgi:type IV secretory pathway VirB3-like protein
MKIPVLKALANPARIFFVPYNLAVLNFIALLFAYLVIFAASLITSGGNSAANPLYFLLVMIAVHSVLAAWSKKEPFLSRIIIAKLALFRKKIPNKLAA